MIDKSTLKRLKLNLSSLLESSVTPRHFSIREISPVLQSFISKPYCLAPPLNTTTTHWTLIKAQSNNRTCKRRLYHDVDIHPSSALDMTPL